MNYLNPSAQRVSRLEARHVLTTIGRHNEFERLLNVELQQLSEELSSKLHAYGASFEQDLYKIGRDYFLNFQILHPKKPSHFNILLNASESAFVIHAYGRHYSLLSAKDIRQLIQNLADEFYGLGLNAA
jgi:hypothetical protein